MTNIEFTIICNLIYNERFRIIAYPNLKIEYFEDESNRLLFTLFCNFVNKYQTVPTKESLTVDCQNVRNISETLYSNTLSLIQKIQIQDVDYDWLIKTSEEWCQKRALFLSLFESISIAQGEESDKEFGAIIPILKDAISVSFDNRIGHDYMNDTDDRYEFYNRVEERVPFDLDMFNKITKGGMPKKTLNVIIAGTGVGKSLCMCHMAAASLLEGNNVLYITCEMSEERIAERIDANLLDINIRDLPNTSKQTFDSKVTALRSKTPGDLIIKEYPTASAHVGHFRSLTSDLSLKKDFRPDIIFVDYINICTSQRYKPQFANSYTLVKGIAEELRGFAVEQNVPLVSATQTTRSGFGSSDIDLTDTSESFGLPATADFMFALSSSEEDEQLGQIMVKQLKNRYNDVFASKRFFVGIDRSKMRLYDVEQSAQEGILDSDNNDDGPLNNKFGGFTCE
jgi:archaellum biogenesis ATPase FlaH